MVFQTTHGSPTYELEVSLTAYRRPEQDQARQHPSKWEEGGQEIWPLAGKELLTDDSHWEREKVVLWDVAPQRLPTL